MNEDTINQLAQDILLQTENAGAQALPDDSISIYELATSGGIGGQLIMTALFVLSIITVYLFVERFIAIRKAQKRDENFIYTIRDFVSDNKLEAAEELCRRTDTIVSNLFLTGLKNLDKSNDDLYHRLDKSANHEVHRIESKLPGLATIAGAAPMLGFLGTVIGMIITFHKMAVAGGQINIELLTNGIYTAMTTTVAGLIVGIVAYIAYNQLVSRVTKIAFMLESYIDEFMDITPNK